MNNNKQHLVYSVFRSNKFTQCPLPLGLITALPLVVSFGAVFPRTIPTASAIAVPPHARVNTRCRAQWNDDRKKLRFLWNGEEYDQPFHNARDVDGSLFSLTALYVQELWCTDSGVVGNFYRGDSDNPASVILYTWLVGPRKHNYLHVRANYTGSPFFSPRAELPSPGNMVVQGSILYFHTRYPASATGSRRLPQLNALLFDEYRGDVDPESLVHYLLRDHSVLLYEERYAFFDRFSPIYPVGRDTLTVSTHLYRGRMHIAIDSVTQVLGYVPQRGPLVLYRDTDTASVISQSREVLTTLHFTCRAFTNGHPVQCFPLMGGQYIWNHTPQIDAGVVFQPLVGGFLLPARLWLLDGIAHSWGYRALAGSGSVPVIAFVDATLWAVESVPDPVCASHSRLHLVSYAVPGMEQLMTEPLNCEWRQDMPRDVQYASSFGVTGVKWTGPWSEEFVLLTAVSIKDHEYHVRGEPELPWSGDPDASHLACDDAFCSIQQPTERAALSCPLPEGRVANDLDAAAQFVTNGKMSCLLGLLRDRRVSAATQYQGVPLITLSKTPDVALVLANYGADLEAKDGRGHTALINVVRRRKNPKQLLDYGAAVCTLPANVFNTEIRIKLGSKKLLRTRAPELPCEPGYHLLQGDNCVGLTVCPRGFFCPGYRGATNVAIPCLAGTYGVSTGSMRPDQCAPCPPDRPMSTPGASSVDECRSGDVVASDAAVYPTLTSNLLSGYL